MPQNNSTGFDAFFRSITESPEFQKSVRKDPSVDSMESLEKSLLEMQHDVNKASEIMRDFDKNFGTEAARNIGANTTSAVSPPKTGNPKDEQATPAIEVQHFTKVEWKPWWFEAVAGMDNLKEELKDSFIKPLRFKFLVEKLRKEWAEKKEKNHELVEKLYTEYEKFKISIPTGMLFYGPPGTGKTFITKKLAEELGCGFVSKNMWEFGSSYLHQTTKNIKDFFTAAKKAAENEPIILFLDEIDSLVSARTTNVDANKAEEVSQFLQEFNGLESAPNLIVIAATNRPDHLDAAILRSGRLDKKIYLGPPDDIARKELFKMYIEKNWRPHEKLDYEELAKLTDWYVSADIEAMSDEVARDASKKLLELIDEAEGGTLTEKHLSGHSITMDALRTTIKETPSSLKMVDMSIYTSWLEKIQ
jgi:SpoVK/Ycf46/Vps4 family AAA+-type ATPase